MANQLTSIGRTTRNLIFAGPSQTKGDTPLGQFYTDGVRKFRFAHVRNASYSVGQVLASYSWQLNASCVALSGVHFNVSASDAAGGVQTGNNAGSNVITVFGLCKLSASLPVGKYEDGTMEILSGPAAGVYGVESYETGGGGVSRITLIDPLISKLSTNALGLIRTNKWYGMSTAKTAQVEAKHNAAGAALMSARVSGYQFVQTEGPGIAHGRAAIGSGLYLAVITSELSTTIKSRNSTLAPIVAKSIGPCGGASALFSVEWMLENR